MIEKICTQIIEKLEKEHIKAFGEKELLLISSQYNGLWLEHAYDAVLYAKLDETKRYLAKNTIEIFIENQKENGQYPFRVAETDGKTVFSFNQIQECLSFLSIAYDVCCMLEDKKLAEKVYDSGVKWINWLESTRMTLNKGLVEMFVGFDTGHDNSGRLDGMSCKGNYTFPNGERADASYLPDDEVAPIIAVDMNCNYFGNLMALSKLSVMLENGMEEFWKKKAHDVKEKLFEICFDEEDVFFYDVDKNGNKRKYLSSTIFHLFMERVLDKDKDSKLIEEIKEKHILNKNEFFTTYPFPSMAINDESTKVHKDYNCWGYYTQGLIVLRCILWMDYYNMSNEFDYICRMWLKAWTDCFDTFKMGQELDPITGKPSKASEWYSSCMLMYVYAKKRLTK